MNRFDRALAILLLLRGGKTFSATDLARRFEVSRRTIYRDIETLSAVGVPVYAEMGRIGGFRLLAGYFLPPVMFTPGEAISLLVGLTLLHSLHAAPFAAERATVEQKLLAAVPDHLRTLLEEARTIIGFEQSADDLFHPEPPAPRFPGGSDPPAATAIGVTITVFLQAILDRRIVRLDYRSPYGTQTDRVSAVPLGVYGDRDRWYLVGKRADRTDSGARLGLWRADRVQAIVPQTPITETRPAFDVRDLLGRTWLRDAMAEWRAESPVTIRLTGAQATQLQRDWYYRLALYEDEDEDEDATTASATAARTVRMSFGEDDREIVFALVRWLGPGAELIAPRAWRSALREQLATMLAPYR